MILDPDNEQVKELIRLAVREDVGTGDVTTDSVLPKDTPARARVVARAEGVVAGLPLIAAVARELSAAVVVELKASDGDRIAPGQVLALITGPARVLLCAERTVLNFLQRLSGIATLTHRFVEALSGTGAKIYDTRKTTPGWRILEKYAVKTGGGENHRMGLFDQVLIKDNHLALMKTCGESLAEAVGRIRAEHPGMVIEIEADSEGALGAALEAGPDVILLDNMTPEELAAAVKLVRKSARERTPQLEASGGVEIETVRAIAESGVDRISVGALTHSAPALDIAVEFETEGPTP